MDKNISSNTIISNYEVKELFLAIGLGNPTSIKFETASLEIGIHSVNVGKKKYLLKSSLRNIKPEEKATQDAIINELSLYKVLENSDVTAYQKIVYSDITKKHIDVNFLILEIQGVPYKKKVFSIRERKLVMYQAGEQLAKIHNIKGLGYGSEKIGIEHSWSAAYKKLVDDIISDLTVKNVNVDTNRIYSVINKLSFLLEDVEPSLIHATIWKGNIYVAEKGTKFLAFAGWENAMWGDLATDFVRLNPVRGTMNNKSFIRGYLSVNPLVIDKNFHIRKNLMKLYLGLRALIYPILKWRKDTQKYIYKKIEGRIMISESLRYLEGVQINE